MSTEEQSSKFTLCVLPTQCGKTFQSVSHIKGNIDQDDDRGRSISLVFTMNSLLNNMQFAGRLGEIEKLYSSEYEENKGAVCIFSSDKNVGDFMHVKTLNELQGLFLNIKTIPRVIVMCSNTKRFGDAVKFINTLNDNKETNKGYIDRVFCYFDELHEYIKGNLRSQIEGIHNFDIVEGILALTATPGEIFQKTGFWSKLNMIKLNDYDENDYAGVNDVQFENINTFFKLPYKKPKSSDDHTKETLGFINLCLETYPDILQDKSYAFIPGNMRQESHLKIKEFLFEKNDKVVVVLINGKEKSLSFNDENGTRKNIPLEGDTEVCDVIHEIVVKNNLRNRPKVVTGFLCVGMGQTLTNKKMGSFTHAIFSHMDLSNDKIYQLFGRITGRMKQWKRYVKTQVYCPEKITTRCWYMEMAAKNLCICHNGEKVSKEVYEEVAQYLTDDDREDIQVNNKHKKEKEIIDRYDEDDKDFEIFDTQEEAQKFTKERFDHRIQKRKTNDLPKDLQEKFNTNSASPEQIIKRFWGIDKKSKVRMLPVFEGEMWIVYWRPSMFEN